MAWRWGYFGPGIEYCRSTGGNVHAVWDTDEPDDRKRHFHRGNNALDRSPIQRSTTFVFAIVSSCDLLIHISTRLIKLQNHESQTPPSL
jgi:hypothetical protein